MLIVSLWLMILMTRCIGPIGKNGLPMMILLRHWIWLIIRILDIPFWNNKQKGSLSQRTLYAFTLLTNNQTYEKTTIQMKLKLLILMQRYGDFWLIPRN